MKTNANPKTIAKAVELVSKSYDNNVILLREPEKITKHITRFVVKVKDRNKPGSFSNKNGIKTAKANESVQLDLIDQIFKLEDKPNLFVDTHIGRIYKEDRKNKFELEKQEEVPSKEPTKTELITENKKGEPIPAISQENLMKLSKPMERAGIERKKRGRKKLAVRKIEDSINERVVLKIKKIFDAILHDESMLAEI